MAVEEEAILHFFRKRENTKKLHFPGFFELEPMWDVKKESYRLSEYPTNNCHYRRIFLRYLSLHNNNNIKCVYL